MRSAHLAEFGIVAPVGRNGVEALLNIVADTRDNRIPEIARACLAALGTQLRALKAQILEFDRLIMAWHRSSEASRSPASAPRWPRPSLPASVIRGLCDWGEQHVMQSRSIRR